MATSAISLGGYWLSCLPLSRNHCNDCDVSLKTEWQSFYDPYFNLLWSNDKQCCSANHVSPKLTKSLLCLVYELMIEDITVGVQRKLKWRVLPQVNLCPLFWLYDPLRIWINTREKNVKLTRGHHWVRRVKSSQCMWFHCISWKKSYFESFFFTSY